MLISLSPLGAFIFELLLIALLWGGWVVLNLWIWQKTKATGNLLMLIGSGALAAFYFVGTFSPISMPGFWLHFFALALVSVGFFLSVKPLVAAQLAALKAKMGNMTSKKEGGGTPPPAS